MTPPTTPTPSPADPHPAPAPEPGHLAGYWKRRSAALFRWLHIYLSMVSFGLLFFFAVTGLTLNHADWFFSDRDTTTRLTATLDPAWLSPKDDTRVAKLEIVEALRTRHHVHGAVGEFRLEPAECTIVFKGPGYSAEARLDRATGRYELSETRLGLIAILNDLHKGRDTGPAWSLVVDLSAALMVLVSLTGLFLLFFLKRRLTTGLLTAAAGTALALAAYYLLVP